MTKDDNQKEATLSLPDRALTFRCSGEEKATVYWDSGEPTASKFVSLFNIAPDRLAVCK